MKICSKCKTEKELSEFNKDKTRTDGYSYLCKFCLKQKQKKYYQNNIDKKVIHYNENKEKISEINKKLVTKWWNDQFFIYE